MADGRGRAHAQPEHGHPGVEQLRAAAVRALRPRRRGGGRDHAALPGRRRASRWTPTAWACCASTGPGPASTTRPPPTVIARTARAPGPAGRPAHRGRPGRRRAGPRRPVGADGGAGHGPPGQVPRRGRGGHRRASRRCRRALADLFERPERYDVVANDYGSSARRSRGHRLNPSAAGTAASSSRAAQLASVGHRDTWHDAPMKYVVCVPDGCADEPVDQLGGRTPLEVAHLPTITALAARGEVGRAAVIPPGMAPGSDVGNMSIFGYDPARFHTGRAPIEAAALGIDAGRRPGGVPLQPGHRGATASWSTSPAVIRPPRRRPRSSAALQAELGGDGDRLPPRRRVPPHPGGARRLGRRRRAPRPTTCPTSRWCWPTGPAAPAAAAS